MKKIVLFFFAITVFTGSSFAQTMKSGSNEIPKNWHLLDPSTTGYNGISLDKAYTHIKTKNLKSNKVIVAVIDSGIDTLHEDLKPVLWVNKKEIPGNGIDDDKNGFIDDVNGWNFIGGKDGRNVKEDSYEGARVFYKLKNKWEKRKSDTASLSKTEKDEYAVYLDAKSKVVGNLNLAELEAILEVKPRIMAGDSVIRKELGKEEYNNNDLKNYTPSTVDARITKSIFQNISKENKSDEISNTQIIDDLNGEIRKGEAALNPPKEYRKEIVQDDETNINDRFYGNNDLMAKTSFHGTHCAGIIAAARNNSKGVDGIADNVSIMVLRAVPDGDEHDKDIANAIRYAVDNGAKVISMSFGKDFSPEKHWVDDAFAYAESKNVLLIHAAGNSAKNIDSTSNFPNPVYVKGGRAGNVITVGASGDKKNGGLTASFSNYGKKEVDVFAPGVGIYSSIPGGNTYGNASGTSMAGPVVAGIAALILQYYPSLTPQQVKYAIEKSVVAPTEKVNIPGTSNKVNLGDISRSGGFVNAYESIKTAGEIKTEKQKEVLPKSKVIKKSKVG
ncbi:MAG: S8 family serine peptidase [Ferruginibacter sp.]